jgi:ribosome maturation factor RimP
MPYYTQSRELVRALGYELVELKIIQSRGTSRVNAVISGLSPGQGIGTEDCAKVHRALQARLEALTGMGDFSMEVASPGVERTIKNAAELSLFIGRMARLWDTRESAWIPGVIVQAASDDVTVDVQQDGSEPVRRTFPFTYIAKAKLLQL